MPKTKYEIIVIDNDEEKTIQNELQKKFPKIIYVPNENKGFGQANNVGSRQAKGDYLFFLNPDTKIFPDTIDSLVSFLEKNKKTGIVAPLLHNMQGLAYQQGSQQLTPFKAIICLSFINKLLPDNPVAKKYFLKDWDKKTLKQVDVIPGTAFMIKKNLFQKINGFDEKFFLYFEEFDLCKRVKALDRKIFIYPQAKVFHSWGSSTKSREDIKNIFSKSRFYYLKKHFGIIPAFFTETFLKINKYTILLFPILIIGALLRSYRINQAMPFIGDQGWFYLSARDMLVSGKIPLVGIATSHPWLHQGAWWTYILGFGFSTLGYNPYTGAYLSIFIDMLAVFFMYKLGSLMFSQRIGVIAGLLYSVSPLVISNARMPYHTSPIPLLTIFFLWSLTNWIRGEIKYFPLIILSLALLYNFEISTFPLAIAFLTILAFGFWKKKKWILKIPNFKFFVFSFFAFMMPMLPMIIYDFGHGFPQTLGFLAWIGYKILLFFGYPPLNPQNTASNLGNIISFLSHFNNKLIFPQNNIIALAITILSLSLLYKTLINQFITKKYKTPFILLVLIFTISLIGIIATKTTSEAYLPILYPILIFITALFFDSLSKMKYTFFPSIILLMSIITINAYHVINMEKGNGFLERLSIAKKIVSQASVKNYNLIGEGRGSEFPSFTMNYEYLTWWLGHGPSKTTEKLKFIIRENEKGIKVYSKIQ